MKALDLPPPPWILAHRGASGEAPENTLESLLLAVDQGSDFLEIDLWLTRDRRLVAFHDAELRSALQRPAAVESLTLYRFQRATRAASGIEAPSLEQILQALPESQPLNLEIKRRGAEPKAIARALAAALGDRSQVLLSSFDWPLLAELAGRLPGTPVAPIADRHANALLAAAIELRSFSLHCHRRIARRSLFLTAARAGQPVLVYTVNRPRLARDLVRRGARGLFTDFPGRLRMSLERDSR